MTDPTLIRITSDGTAQGTKLYDAATGEQRTDVREVMFKVLRPGEMLRGRLVCYVDPTDPGNQNVRAEEVEFEIGEYGA